VCRTPVTFVRLREQFRFDHAVRPQATKLFARVADTHNKVVFFMVLF
jgi:hypothetical protein